MFSQCQFLLTIMTVVVCLDPSSVTYRWWCQRWRCRWWPRWRSAATRRSTWWRRCWWPSGCPPCSGCWGTLWSWTMKRRQVSGLVLPWASPGRLLEAPPLLTGWRSASCSPVQVFLGGPTCMWCCGESTCVPGGWWRSVWFWFLGLRSSPSSYCCQISVNKTSTFNQLHEERSWSSSGVHQGELLMHPEAE